MGPCEWGQNREVFGVAGVSVGIKCKLPIQGSLGVEGGTVWILSLGLIQYGQNSVK